MLLSKRESDAGLAAQEHGQIQARINHLTLVELQPLIERLNVLTAQEAKLNHLVTGQGYTNELGLVIPARPR